MLPTVVVSPPSDLQYFTSWQLRLVTVSRDLCDVTNVFVQVFPTVTTRASRQHVLTLRGVLTNYSLVAKQRGSLATAVAKRRDCMATAQRCY